MGTPAKKVPGYAKVCAAQPHSTGADSVYVEADLSRGLHAFSLVGLTDRAVEEARERITSAIKNSGYPSPKATNKRIILSLSPANVRKEGSHYDVALAISYLIAAGEIPQPQEEAIYIGELQLNGKVRSVKGVLVQLLSAYNNGIRTAYVPEGSAAEATLIPNMVIHCCSSLHDVIVAMNKTHRGTSNAEIAAVSHESFPSYIPLVDFSDVRGQETAKRALEIAAAGRHNIVLYGPPGTGKTLLAKALQGVLPALTHSEVVDVTAIHSAAGLLPENTIMHMPPWRSPHHTASYAALIGGGMPLRAGEVTLAHKGVLFLDEFAEFDARSLEALRQPLEERTVTIARAHGIVHFPADCMVVAAMNPADTVTTNPAEAARQAQRQARKISRPIADRMDIWVEVGAVPYHQLHGGGTGEASSIIRSRVADARQHTTVKECTPEAHQFLVAAVERLSCSPRSYYRILRVAQTIATLAHDASIREEHISEALHYRPRGLFGLL